jgi:hypothetical protein
MDPSAAIILLIAYVMPGRIPDIQYRLPEATIEDCWAEAKEFVKRGVTPHAKEKGAIAVLAACRVKAVDEEDG